MERIHQLILKLKEQYEQQASPAQLLSTAQLLHQELVATQPVAKTLGTSKISVLMPVHSSPNLAYHNNNSFVAEDTATDPAPDPSPVIATAPARAVYTADEFRDHPYAPKPQVVEEPLKDGGKTIHTETVLVDQGKLSLVQENGQLDMIFDPNLEIPTLTQHLNGPGQQGESINDKLKQGKTELVEFLKDTPVKDLRKAVGINDRFTFINELFRGDEAMYERSIKTINGFNIYPEAEYWITRELKTKLGWLPDNDVVEHFDNLVRRRFLA